MNDVKKCSISGIAFTLEVDAYEELSRYLQELHEQYKENPDGEEIIADIEARIAELILSTQDNNRTVALPLVKNILAQMGSAAEIDSESQHEEERRGSSRAPRIPRRLYRDADAGKLGGVCAGLANYFDIDTVWVRLMLFLPLVVNILLPNLWTPMWLDSLLHNLFVFFVLCYLVMWFAVPAARSARQKLEMKGEKITTESIRQTTSKRPADVDGHSKAVVADTVSTLGKVVLILLKIFAGILLLGLVLCSCALIVGAFALVFVPEGQHVVDDFGVWIPLLGIFTVLIPCLLIIYVLMCLVASRQPNGKGVLAIFIAWVVVILALLGLLIRAGLHEEFYQMIPPPPTYNQHNLLNDPSSTVEIEAGDINF